eukprot:1731851-Prymnesium_polylepis.1
MRCTPTSQRAGVARTSPRSSAAMVLLWSTILATDTEAVNRRMATQPSEDVICYHGPGEQYSPAGRLAIRRFTASVSVASTGG